MEISKKYDKEWKASRISWKNTVHKEEYGDDLKIIPDQRFTTLRITLNAYYLTYDAKIGGIGDGGHERTANVYPCVLFMCMFLEKFVVEHFDNEYSWVSRGLDKQDDSRDLNYLDQNTVSLRILLNRLYHLLDTRDSSVKGLECFNGHREALMCLVTIRNDMTHNGNRIPKLVLIDKIMVNNLLPLCLAILQTQQMDYRSLDCHTYSGIRVVESISKLTIKDTDMSGGLTDTKRRLCHYKAIGAAIFRSPMFYGLKDLEIQAFGKINEQVKLTYEARSFLVLNESDSMSLHTCPCCGLHTLITFGWRWEAGATHAVPSLASCQTCKYKIHKDIGEPKSYDLMEETIYNPIPFDEWKEMSGAQAWIDFQTRAQSDQV